MKFKVRLLFAGFIVSFLLVAALSVISFLRTSNLSLRIALVEHSYNVVNTINKTERDVRTHDKSAFRFLVTRDSAYKLSFDAATAAAQKSIGLLRTQTADNPVQQNLIILLQSDLALYLADCRQVMTGPVIPESKVNSSEAYQHSRLLMAAALSRLSNMTAIEDSLLHERLRERNTYQQVTAALIRTLSIVFGLLTIVLFFFLLREFRQRLKYQLELQQKMTEIAQSKRELEHIAYATSHDLQEPLRKIRILTDKWYGRHKEGLSDESRDTMERVVAAASRMQELVGELMVLASLNDAEQTSPCPLLQYAEDVWNALADATLEKDTRIRIEPLPVVQGHPDQLRLLFKNLLDNAIKFSKAGAPVHVHITAQKASGTELPSPTDLTYQCITVADNGIGFDNKQADKMFGIFRQLHGVREGNTGKGAGLAICQRIMNNHHGHIIAHGFPGEGATFKLYFPLAG